MAKKKPTSPEGASAEEPGVYTVKIDPEMVPKLKIVAAALGMSGPNYVNSKIAEMIARDFTAAMETFGFEPKKR